MKTKYKVGDIVDVTDWEYIYSGFKDMFELLNFKNKSVNFWSSEFSHKNWKIFAITEPSFKKPSSIIYIGIVNENDNELLIGSEGIKLSIDVYEIY